MSVQRVQQFLAEHAPEATVTVLEKSTATVAEAAEAFEVESGQIAKTLSFRVNDEVVLLVMAGTARIDNKKYKQLFGVKARMLPSDEVETLTGYPPGGVCPFAAADAVKVYCDHSLKSYDEVLPAGGSVNSGVRIAPARLASITGADWIDVTR
ncbi:YbaK/EbsC family protein [Rouxiella badensis]|jgi:prolyl-tRNA editing enzyme YbaK/EbsC (Cys-tRNA(Pro) deacylase)|uniref:YbaK/EbsC family protein n=1 Tax=Rouxiella badensis TaxID=1646377 RepID=UPI001D14AEA3|nr:YbaK/EbsC family protein [Rouxiella badensis]MCC3719396.1 YbaK/EbsC family protein [Rouxiella badensis]MCC3728646.1 YbaK/EbsC family protein [Rouxiella badensis]MCC3739358.1 YbaK/EbsC family protein [Rouxiella badensis]